MPYVINVREISKLKDVKYVKTLLIFLILAVELEPQSSLGAAVCKQKFRLSRRFPKRLEGENFLSKVWQVSLVIDLKQQVNYIQTEAKLFNSSSPYQKNSAIHCTIQNMSIFHLIYVFLKLRELDILPSEKRDVRALRPNSDENRTTFFSS